MNIKKDLEKREADELSKYATLSKNTKGRAHPLSHNLSYQTDFQFDITKILESKSFRRLKNKTQVFVNPRNDHYMTRMTHTLEVASIAKDISRALRLNIDLTEAIALAHDIGHAPFGHMGEEALNDSCSHGFSHEKNGRRIVETLEDGGLNLTLEVRDGIENHRFSKKAATPEGNVVRFSDKIAYINNDIEDAYRARILNGENFPKKFLEAFGKTTEERRDTLVMSVISASMGKKEISMEKSHLEMFKELREFMFKNVYFSKKVVSREKEAKEKIKRLFLHFKNHPEQIPSHYTDEDVEQRACDYVSGMTDNFAIRRYNEIFREKTESLTKYI